MRLAPNDARAHHNLGIVLESSGDLAGAIEHYRAALEIDPGYTLARRRLDQAIARQRDSG